jgi:cell division protein FtsZ
MAEMAARPLSLAASRGPIRPSLSPDAPVEPLFQPAAAPEPQPVPEPEVAEIEEQAPAANDSGVAVIAQGSDELELTDEESQAEAARGGYASLTGVRPGRAEPLDLALDQVDEEADGAGQDELLLDASRLAQEDGPVSPLATRRRGLVPGGPGGAGGRSPVAGNTLFERMANLSRGVKPASADEEDDDEDDDSSAISIPRFLGRQNNQ